MYSYARTYLHRCVDFSNATTSFNKLTKVPFIVLKPVEDCCVRLYVIPKHKSVYIAFKIYGYEVYMRY